MIFVYSLMFAIKPRSLNITILQSLKTFLMSQNHMILNGDVMVSEFHFINSRITNSKADLSLRMNVYI